MIEQSRPSNSGPLFRVLGLLDKVRRQGTGYSARCPGPRHTNGDRDPSLGIALGYDGRVLLNCHRGCGPDEILNALNLDWQDLFEKSQSGNPVRRFRLLNAEGKVVAEHVREDVGDDKKLWWEHGGKRGLNGTAVKDLPLYRMPELAQPGPVIVTEGEKAADALADLGLLAVGTITGAGETPSDLALAPLQGREVWLWPDNDVVGREHMARIAAKIKPTPKWISWPDAVEPGEDAADYVARGGTADGIKAMVVAAVAEPTSLGTSASPRIWRASELMSMRFDPVRWAIPGLLPAGLAILAGRPKLGKSWLGLGWVIDVCRGAPVLKKMDVVQGEALYLALEDGPQRMQERLALMLGDNQPPESLHIVTEWPRMNEGGLEMLDQFLTEHKKTRLVVIDTFKRVRPIEKNSQRLYDLDYDAIQPVAALARLHNVAIVVVLHTRKGESSDPLEMVSGTLGLSGAADCVLVLRRERGQADASLFVTGRDVEEQDLALRWEKDDVLGWSLLGNADQFRKSKERQQIIDAIQSMPGMSPAEIADAIGKPRGGVRYLLFAMTRDADIRTRDGKYYPSTNANSPNSPFSPPVLISPPDLPLTPNSLVSGNSAVRDRGAVRAVRAQVRCIPCGRPAHAADQVCPHPRVPKED